MNGNFRKAQSIMKTVFKRNNVKTVYLLFKYVGYAKGSYHKLVSYNMPLIFYAALFIIFMSHFYFAFKSILNQSCLLL